MAAAHTYKPIWKFGKMPRYAASDPYAKNGNVCQSGWGMRLSEFNRNRKWHLKEQLETRAFKTA